MLNQLLSKWPFLILDGALATELEKRGAHLNDPLWSAKVLLEQPSLIEAVHLDYMLAGANIVSTATYQASIEGFMSKGYSYATIKQIFKASVQLAENARKSFQKRCPLKEPPLIAASLGSYGAFLADGSEYKGNYSVAPSALGSFHQARIDLLKNTSMDLLLFETIPSAVEAEVILSLIAQYDLPAILSFSCKDAQHLCDGTKFEAAIQKLYPWNNIAGIGINCLHPDLVQPLLNQIPSSCAIPVVVYPNDGRIWDAQQHCWLNEHTVPNYPDLWTNWLSNGTKVIGGCCNTSPTLTKNLYEFRSKRMDRNNISGT